MCGLILKYYPPCDHKPANLKNGLREEKKNDTLLTADAGRMQFSVNYSTITCVLNNATYG